MFQGNNVRDGNADMALFSELGSSPATMEAGKAVDAYGSQPGFVNQQNDGAQAYTQALMEGAQTIRKNKGRGRGRGSRYPGGSAEGSVTSADDYIFNITVETRNMSSLQPAKLGRDSQMPALFQMAHRMDRWQNWHRGMPASQ